MAAAALTHPTSAPFWFWLTFFFYWSGRLRDLHSFPTRRSSDLHPGAAAAVRAQVLRNDPAAYVATCHRSEEHTSELQSRRDLVCRLLLEKKKSRARLLATVDDSEPL